MQDTNAIATGNQTGDPERHHAGDQETEDRGYWDIAQNEQIATPDGPMSREELEDAETERFVTDYPL